MSFALCYWALCTLRRSGTTVDIKRPSTTVVMGGLFRFSRNPIYLSTVLLQIGVGVWANSLWFFGLALLSYALLTWGVILREERYLGRKFGEAYAEYRARVRRWL
ncbi:isoprenylcysteine carboxylmethyltransferase family protein [bacterium AH-315-L15]|nr:isoprenylcysteine carboxylmethyltransferase family protein [bacterium AH-315-L15]